MVGVGKAQGLTSSILANGMEGFTLHWKAQSMGTESGNSVLECLGHTKSLMSHGN